MRLLLTFWTLLVLMTVKAQEQGGFGSEITLLSENDNYDFGKTDRYYSNGLMWQYNTLGRTKSTSRWLKKINNWEAGIQIFNPYRNNQSLQLVMQLMDRPYAGWLYGSYGQTRIYPTGNVLQFGISAGVVGPASQAQQVQEYWHRLWRLYKVYAWDRQVKNEPGVNFHLRWWPQLYRDAAGRFSMHGLTAATLGNTFTHARIGLLLQTGRLSPTVSGVFWGAALDRNERYSRRPTEFIFFAEPSLMLQAYNATLQGGMFVSDKGPFLTPIQGWVAQARLGTMISGQRMAFCWYYTFRTREGARMRKGESWGSIGITYRFHQ